ncbi:hypothetical protein CASFOL_025975 [Castilleja foliolosa]|uniref:Uncharacterized protein n=1 Tax=Castilleja foliolosa TaxID=1961234 RepID=A0ABD3CSL8_9LAMI
MGKGGKGKSLMAFLFPFTLTHRKTTPTASASNPSDAQYLPDEFISKHPSRQPGEALIHARRAPIVGHVMYTYSRPNPESGENSSIDRIHSFPGSDAVDELNVVGITQNGVVCIVQGSLALNFTLWNPATGSVLNIPEPDLPNRDLLIGGSAGFGFDPSSNEYAIIRIVRFSQETEKYPDLAVRFNFQTGRWDWLDNEYLGMLPFWFLKPTCDAVVNDVPYWKVRGIDLSLELVWFDTRTSVFNLESLPSEWDNSVSVVMGEIREGNLGAIVRGDKDHLQVWTRNGGEWSETYRVSKSMWGRRLMGFYADAEIVYELPTGSDDEPYVHMMKLLLLDDDDNDDDGIRRGLEDVDDCCLEGALYYTCKMMRYKKSLTPMPSIGALGDS